MLSMLLSGYILLFYLISAMLGRYLAYGQVKAFFGCLIAEGAMFYLGLICAAQAEWNGIYLFFMLCVLSLVIFTEVAERYGF